MTRITAKKGNPNYVAGRRAEYEARDILLSEGYAVMRAAGSKGAADLVGVKPVSDTFYGGKWTPFLEVLWVSCKRGTGRADAAQRDRLRALPGRCEVWTRQRGGVWVREVVK